MTSMNSHEVDYKIFGESIQFVEVELDPQETIVAEAGAMVYMTEGIRFETKMGDGSNASDSVLGKLFKAGARALMGESLFLTHFTNGGFGKQQVAFSAPFPGTIIPINLSLMPGNQIVCQKDAFICAALGTKVSITLNKRLGAGFFGGEGFIMQKLQGDGMAFIHAGGTVIERTLNNETLRVDTGCVVAFDGQIDFDIQRAGGLKTMLFGGEGLFLATLRGTGRVWLQSMPISKLAQEIVAMGGGHGGGSSSREGGGILGNLFE